MLGREAAFSDPFLEDTVPDGESEGSLVRSMDCIGQMHFVGRVSVQLTARIHQPISSSFSTMRLLSVSMESTDLPSEKLLSVSQLPSSSCPRPMILPTHRAKSTIP